MAREFFKNLPDTSTPLTAERLNGLLDGEEAMGNLVVDSIKNKNLLSLTNFINNGTGRTSYSINGNNITITTLSSGTYRYVYKIIDNLEIGKTYSAMIGYLNDESSETNGKWGIVDSNGNYYSNSPITIYQQNWCIFTARETSVQFRVGYLDNSCTAGDTLTVGNIQIEEGPEPTSFTPYDTYSNKALANEDVVVGSIRSKNLFNKRNVTTSFRIGPTGNPYRDSSYSLSEYIEVKPSVSYTYSRYTSGGGSSAVAFYDSNKTFISRTMWSSYADDSSIIFQTTSSTKYIRICELGTLLDNMQLEEGNVFTPYSPYQSLNYEDIFIKKGFNTSTGTGLRIWFTRPGQQFFIFGKSYINSSDKFWEYHIGLNNAGISGVGYATYNDISNNLGVAPSINNENLYFDLMCGSYTQVLIISADYFDVNAI